MIHPHDFEVSSPTHEAVSRGWLELRARRNRGRRGMTLWYALGASSLAACAGAWLVLRAPQPAIDFSLPVTALSSDALPHELTLEDGSHLRLAPQTQLQLNRSSEANSISLELKRGQLDCEVSPKKDRVFRVLAGSVTVTVLGTSFSVRHDQRDPMDSFVTVKVSRGLVQVTRSDSGTTLLLHPGESFSSEASMGAKSAPEPASSVETPAPAPAPSSGAASSALPDKLGESARELFERATQARRSGDLMGAAATYESLLRRFPADNRSGIAALELGRLRMDRLGDLAGAQAPLRQALGFPAFREDAQARLTLVYAKLGNRAACQASRAQYDSQFPQGVHRNKLAAACPQ